ncbi:MAG TPA: response regulator transcription factor [Trinickia sp.]|uniref:response regulator transcription factor n=1 Tax=Trinickia sp. TaxID=2571163 RepID=UPI002CE8AA1B|nr:response regulator transcription factor [Trinickia sp.]HTI16575.1 response regulator transcription factor [Trinickia sp.]
MSSIFKPAATRAVGCQAGILVIEDDLGVGTEVQAVLEDGGFAVEWVKTGADGLRRAIDGDFKTIVLDRMLPDVDGLSVLSTLRNIGKRTPVLILSALSAVDERVRGLRAGGDDYLTKPFDGLELTARLNAILRRRAPSSRDTVLRVGDLALDTDKRVAERAAQTIELTAREYALLEYLMRQAGQVVTRAMLFESAWNYHFDARTNVIDMHIGQLRRRISLNGTLSSMIHTVRNIGYILDAHD